MKIPDPRALLFGSPTVRRAITVPTVAAAAGTLTTTAWLWAPTALVVDSLTDGRRFGRFRSLSIATAWSTLETTGVALSLAQWALGRSGEPAPSYALQRWWVHRLLDALRIFGRVQLDVEGGDAVAPGPVVMMARHASIADSLLPVWLLASHDMHPRYVLKRELLVDPCLDIVGNRVPNHFVIRDGDDTEAELDALRRLSVGMGPQDAAVIFPEGTVTSAARRARALERIAERDPDRARRLGALRALGPPRHAGIRALLEGCPDADVVLVAHRGFEQIRRLADVPERLPLAQPIRVNVERVSRADVPTGPGFVPWLDERWLRLDAWVGS
jgi:1-acyl-sn-glycerol-3-phosphate acyltransferase